MYEVRILFLLSAFPVACYQSVRAYYYNSQFLSAVAAASQSAEEKKSRDFITGAVGVVGLVIFVDGQEGAALRVIFRMFSMMPFALAAAAA